MSKDNKIEDEIFKNFKTIEKGQLSRSRALANYLIEQIDLGRIAEGSKLPSVKDLQMYTSLSHANVNEALRIIKVSGYLIITSGIRSSVKLPGTDHPGQHQEIFYADHHGKQPNFHALNLDKLYHKFRLDHSRATVPGLENSISQVLINTLVNRFNASYNLSYKPANLYYTHDYQLIIKAIGLVLKEDTGVVVITAQTDHILRLALESTGLVVLEVGMDKDGFSVEKLTELCLKQRIAAVFITSKASFPDFTYTTAERIKDLFILQDTHQFKIIENDFYSPWLTTQRNLVLELAADAIDAVIYLYPISYLINEVSRLRVVVAHPKIIERIRSKVNAEGKQAYLSIANATSDLLLHKEFIRVEELVRLELLSLRKMIWEVFSASNFWQMNDFEGDSGPGFFLKPANGSFPENAYQQLHELGVFVYDPQSYRGSALDGLRYDLSGYISKKNSKIILQKVEKHSRNIYLLSRGMAPVKV